MVKSEKKDITEIGKSVIPNKQKDITIKMSSLSKELQELLKEIRKNFNCPQCNSEFTYQNWFNNCVSDPQDHEEYCHCFNCGYDSREEKEKDEVPF